MRNEKKLIEIFEMIGLYINSKDYDNKLELDSLQLAILIVEIEDKFQISIDDTSKLYTFNDLVDLINICE